MLPASPAGPIHRHRRPLARSRAALAAGRLSVGFLGGSITAPGSGKSWPEPLLGWLGQRFPAVRLSVENEAIGATGSDLAAFRAGATVLARGCDLVFVEYAVNDASQPELIDLLARADQQFGLSARERIALGLIAQHGSLTALEFGRLLQIEGDDRIRVWLGTLPAKGVVLSRGQTRATEYFIAPAVLRSTQFKGPTTLKAIAPHRLEELIRADLALYPTSGLSELLARIGPEIPIYKVKRTLEAMRHRGVLQMTGLRRWARYSLAQPLPNKSHSMGDSMTQTTPPDSSGGANR